MEYFFPAINFEAEKTNKHKIMNEIIVIYLMTQARIFILQKTDTVNVASQTII